MTKVSSTTARLRTAVFVGARVFVALCLVAGALPVAIAGVFETPISQKVVAGHVRLPGGQVAEFFLGDGELLRIENSLAEYKIGVAAAVDTLDPTKITLIPVNIRDLGKSEELELLGPPRQTAVGLVEEFVAPSGDRFAIQTLSIEEPVVLPYEAPQCGGTTSICCVTCGHWTICGRCVRLWCGNCGNCWDRESTSGTGALAHASCANLSSGRESPTAAAPSAGW
ncbi:MAG: hypothetical protein GY725_15550 [bacterium]|nr:hypothetical protein [bacterium]